MKKRLQKILTILITVTLLAGQTAFAAELSAPPAAVESAEEEAEKAKAVSTGEVFPEDGTEESQSSVEDASLSGNEAASEEKAKTENAVQEEPAEVETEPAQEEETQTEISEEVMDKIILPEEENVDLSQALVVFKDGTTAKEAEQRIEEAPLVTVAENADPSDVESDGIVAVELAPEATFEEAAAEIAQAEEVAYVQPNFIYEALADPSYTDIGTDDPGDNWHVAAVRAPEAWELQKTDGAIRVAVIDTGCDLLHPDLAGNIDTVNAYQVIDTDAFDYTSGSTVLHFSARKKEKLTTSFGTNGDLGQHGTAVSGIIAALPDNGIGSAGISYNAKVLPINIFNTATTDSGKTSLYAFTKGVRDAYNYLFSLIDAGKMANLRVVNLSLGGYDANSNDKALKEIIAKAKNNYGIVTVCAGGNKANDSSYYNGGQISNSYPADFEECVSVCSINQSGWETAPNRSSSSDFNSAKDISAPGVNIYSTSPGGQYMIQSGTSMAAPCVSAVFALVFAAKPSLSAGAAENIVYETARDITGKANDVFSSGAVCAEGWDKYTGWGLVDACAAVRKAKGLPVDETQEIVNGGIYILHSALNADKVLDINGASTANGGNLQIYDGNGTNAQKFIFLKNTDGTWTIYSYRSGLVLDIKSNKTANGTNVWQYESNGTLAQKWKLQYNSDGSVTFVAANSGKVLDVSGAKTANKTNVQIYASNGTAAQKFAPEKTGDMPFLPGKYILHASQNQNYVMDVSGGKSSNGANIQIYKKNGTQAQTFTLIPSIDGSYEIRTAYGKALDVKGNKTANLTNVQQYAANRTGAQRWKITVNSDGSLTFTGVTSGKVLDIKSNKMQNGSNISIYTSNGTTAQKFIPESVG